VRPKHLLWSLTAVVTAVVTPVAMSLTSGATKASAAAPPACAKNTTVKTDKGAVCGLEANGVKSWLGIRYAAPPVGKLRWASPEPAPAWGKTFQATSEGNACPQVGFMTALNEDCLNLNVRVPSNPGNKPLPVMVQIHGGGFLVLSASDASHFVTAGHVISVEVNYRLGIFGFLAHSAFGAHAGDYAIQDQQAALRWVQKNISRFGGDPHNVTIYGASAGGSSVCDQTASPTAKGLFQKGISESGEYNSLLGVNTQWQAQDCHAQLPTEKEAQARGDRFAAAVGCGKAKDAGDCLRKVPVQTLLDKAGNGLGPDNGTIAPIVNGTTLPMSPGDAFATGHVNDVSLVIGVARDETQLPSAETEKDYKDLVQEQYGDHAQEVFNRYPLSRFPNPAPFLAYRTIIADSDAVCPMLLNDERLARHIPVYAYEVDDADAPPMFFLDPNKPNGSYHVDEDAIMFPSDKLDANQQAFSEQLTSQWTGFARTGNPTVKGTPMWSRFTTENPSVMSLVEAGDSVMTTEIGRQHNCDFWNAMDLKAHQH
jgi:para-nitrobenzyl esterase